MIVDSLIFPPLGPLIQSVFEKPERSEVYRIAARMKAPRSLGTRSVEDMFVEMDGAGIDRALVRARLTVPKFDATGAALPSESVTNDDIADWVRRYPNRFIGIATIGRDDLVDAEAILNRIATGSTFNGVFLNPGHWGEPLTANGAQLYPIYKLCQALDLAVIVLVGGQSGPDLTYNSPLAVDLVAADFPRLKLVVAHGGWPWVGQAVSVALRRPNVYLAPDLYIFGFAGWRDYVEAGNGVLQDRLIFSSVYPYLPMSGATQRYRRLFSPKVLPKVMGANVLQALGLPT